MIKFPRVARRCFPQLTVTLLLTAGCLSQNPDAGLEQGLQLLEEGRTTLAENALANARDHFTKLTQQHPDNAVYFYELARVNAYRCEAYAARATKRRPKAPSMKPSRTCCSRSS